MSDFDVLGKPWCEVELADFTLCREKAAGRHRRVPLPTGSGVYALLDAKRRPLYIGMASMIDRRVCQHWYPHCYVSFFSCNESVARLIERRLIAKHQPRFNTFLTGKPMRTRAIFNSKLKPPTPPQFDVVDDGDYALGLDGQPNRECA